MEGKSCPWKHIFFVSISLPFLLGIPLLIHRGLYGEYGFDVHGFSVLVIGLIPFVCLFILRGIRLKLPASGLLIVGTVLAIAMILFYLSRNGLWCAQHPSVTREMCAKLNQFALFASTSNLHSWWLTLGDLLAIQRGRAMPMPWEHDIDICISREEFPHFEKALASRVGFFQPEPIHYENNHWYIPIDMKRLGLKAREAEGVNIDIWICSKSFKGNISRVAYCNGFMNVPELINDRHVLLTKTYGDYSAVQYEHHDNMCRLWNG